MTIEYDLLIRNSNIIGKGIMDIGITNNQIQEVASKLPGTADTVIDADEHLVTPSFVDAHIHLNQAFIGGDQRWKLRTFQDMIAAISEYYKHEEPPELIKARVMKVLRRAIRNGTTALRSHVTVSNKTGLQGLQAALDLKTTIAPWIDLQVVVFLVGGFSRVDDGGEALLRSGMQLGADVIGGMLRIDPDPRPYLDLIFKVAKEFNTDVDIHVDESNNPQHLLVEAFAEKALEHQWFHRTTASHMCSLYWVNQETANRIIGKLKAARMNVITNPMDNLYIRGPNPTLPTGPTRINDLLASQIPVGIGTDSAQDMFCPLANTNMQLASLLLAYQRPLWTHKMPTKILTMATITGSKILRLDPPYGIAPGCQANLIIFEGKTVEDMFIHQQPPKHVISKGSVVVQDRQSLILENHSK